jgi:hypothetical protein
VNLEGYSAEFWDNDDNVNADSDSGVVLFGCLMFSVASY